jgi:nucleotide-binding universal stress UspA family protein
MRERLQGRGLKVRSLLAVGPAADSLLQECETGKAKLVVMATHGRSGLNRAFFGSVATAMLRHGYLPLLLIRPEELDNLPAPDEETMPALAELTPV